MKPRKTFSKFNVFRQTTDPPEERDVDGFGSIDRKNRLSRLNPLFTKLKGLEGETAIDHFRSFSSL